MQCVIIAEIGASTYAIACSFTLGYEMSPFRSVFLLVSSLALSGCMAMLADQECREGNAREAGRHDGGDGFSRADSWRQTCEDTYGLKFDRAGYEQGFREGVAQLYCTPQRARALGAKGTPFDSSMCPSGRDLKAAHQQGLKEYCTPQSAYNVGTRNESFMYVFCSENLSELRSAHDKGVAEGYCLPENAFQAGLKMDHFDTAPCPPAIKAAYQYGEDARDVQSEIDRLETELSPLRGRVYDKSLSDRERQQLRWRVDDLERQKRLLSDQLRALERRAVNP